MNENLFEVLRAFRLDAQPVSCEPYGCGHINVTYLAVTESGRRYILQKINNNTFRDVAGLITVLEATGQTETQFCDYGNVMRTVTLAQLGTLQLEIIVYGQMLYARKWELREAVNAAQTPEAVAAIEINFDDLPAPVVSVAAA